MACFPFMSIAGAKSFGKRTVRVAESLVGASVLGAVYPLKQSDDFFEGLLAEQDMPSHVPEAAKQQEVCRFVITASFSRGHMMLVAAPMFCAFKGSAFHSPPIS